MATYTLAATDKGAYEKTLVATTADTVVFSRQVHQGIEIVTDGADEIYYTLDGSTPVAAAATTYLIPAYAHARRIRRFPGNSTGVNTVLKLVSAGTPMYSVSEFFAEQLGGGGGGGTVDGEVEITNVPDVQVTNTPTVNISSGQFVSLTPSTTGGSTIHKTLDLDESEEEVKATAGQVYGLIVANLHATDRRYIKFYNATAANVTVGTTVPVITIPLSAGKEGWIAYPNGISFGTAICVAATTGLADNDTGAPGANEVVATVLYK